MAPDTVSPEERSRIMRQVRSRDTKPELRVRRALHKAGLRFRLHDKRLPGHPDLALRKHQTVVFVHGCLWHWHGCSRSRMPASNEDYWRRKIARNVERDAEHAAALQRLGWRVEIVWECEIAPATESLIARLTGKGAGEG